MANVDACSRGDLRAFPVSSINALCFFDEIAVFGLMSDNSADAVERVVVVVDVGGICVVDTHFAELSLGRQLLLLILGDDDDDDDKVFGCILVLANCLELVCDGFWSSAVIDDETPESVADAIVPLILAAVEFFCLLFRPTFPFCLTLTFAACNLLRLQQSDANGGSGPSSNGSFR